MSSAKSDRRGIPGEKECIDLLFEVGCKKRVVVHCATVRAVAEAMAERIPQADMDLVIAGALLHDIGRSVTHSIMHGPVGAQILAERGYPPVLTEIVRRHTGAGLDQQDVEEMGLPPGDYLLRTIEQKIVAHADNLVSNDEVVPHEHAVQKLADKGAVRGAQRIEDLHWEISELYGEDLDNLVKRLGPHPKLKGVKPRRPRRKTPSTS